MLVTHLRISARHLLLGMALGACSQAVRRGDAPVDTSATKTSLPVDGMPDLKKRVWIMPFGVPNGAENITGKNATAQSADGDAPEPINVNKIAMRLHRKLIEIFPSDKTPYLVQSPEDEEAFRSVGIDDMKDPKDVAKALKGSDITGFLFGKITKIEATEGAKDSEGLIRKRNYELQISVKYELYDTNGGRRVAGTETKQIYHESRSEVLGMSEAAGIADQNERLLEMVPALADKILTWANGYAGKLAWYGRVLRIDGGRLYLSAGRRTGLMVGDVLKVLESNRDIVDPQTGMYVGPAPGRMKGTVKVVQYFGVDGSMAVLQSGGGILPDDRVELY